MEKKKRPISERFDPDRILASLGTVVDERFWVEEVSPPWYDGGYYGYGHMPEKVVDTKGYFATEAEAQEYMDSMQPSTEKNTLRIRSQKCYERLERRWL